MFFMRQAYHRFKTEISRSQMPKMANSNFTANEAITGLSLRV